jgi:AGCS family alanine or glycine:cation symporter
MSEFNQTIKLLRTIVWGPHLVILLLGVVVASSFLFGYSSLIAVPYYGEIAFSYLFGVRIKKPYRWAFCGLVFLGAILEVEVTWSIGDIFNGMMALTNLIGLIGLSGLAIHLVRNYFLRLNSF